MADPTGRGVTLARTGWSALAEPVGEADGAVVMARW